MSKRIVFVVLSVWIFAGAVFAPEPARACCAVAAAGRQVVNADQTVIILWDAQSKTQHFIRQATFAAEADDFAFLVPSPTQPELSESGDEAFSLLRTITAPPVPRGGEGGGFGCAAAEVRPAADSVRVLERKVVAGLDAAVLEADSAEDLMAWLNANGYAFSPQVEAWAEPYVESGWKITAMKIAPDEAQRSVSASALRMSFTTERPLFPYREPDDKGAAEALGAHDRLLRIYFLGDTQYAGELTPEHPWTGKVAWSGELDAGQRGRILAALKLPESTGPRQWWLTEFEDAWPYRVAPADVYFSPNPQRKDVRRAAANHAPSPDPIDLSAIAVLAAMLIPAMFARLRRRDA